MNSSETATISDMLWPRSPALRGWRFLVLALAGSMFIALCAKLNVPFYPVPMTMQTFAIVMLGAAFGSRLAGASVLAYIAQGALGLPVFATSPATGAGLAYLLGPTGGYILGFLPAAILIGLLAERGWDKSLVLTFAAMLAGVGIIYASGLAWLGAVIGWDKPLLEIGFFPFILSDLFKIALASVAIALGWSAIRKFRGPAGRNTP